MQFERGKPPETPNAPYRAARMKDERWRSAEPGFEPGRAGPRFNEKKKRAPRPTPTGLRPQHAERGGRGQRPAPQDIGSSARADRERQEKRSTKATMTVPRVWHPSRRICLSFDISIVALLRRSAKHATRSTLHNFNMSTPHRSAILQF
jgi:hypothetical protein